MDDKEEIIELVQEEYNLKGKPKAIKAIMLLMNIGLSDACNWFHIWVESGKLIIRNEDKKTLL